MGLFRKKNKKDDFPNNINFENLNDSDDSFLVSAISSSPNNDYFTASNNEGERTRGYGANSGLAYYNKYSSTNQKLASSNVVDIGAIKKPEPVVKTPEPVKPVEPEDDFIDDGDILLKPVDADTSSDDEDFDSFFEDFMKRTKTEDKVSDEVQKVEAPSPLPKVDEKPKPKRTSSAPRKKKRAIDIDIISGTGGGDII